MTPGRSFADAARHAACSTWEVSRELVRAWQKDRIGGRAAEIAFYALLGLFPGMLALASALGSLGSIVGDDAAARAQDEVLTFLQRVLTNEASGTVESVQSLFDRPSHSALTVGTVAALWAASRGFAAVISALDAVYDLPEGRRHLKARGIGLLLALGTVAVGSVLLTMLVVGPLFGNGTDLADRIGMGGTFATLWDWARWPLILTVTVLWTATILHVGPNHRTPWRSDLPGAALTTAAWAAFSVALHVYLSLAWGTNQVLGVLGGALTVVLWLYLLAVGLLLGGELNAVLAQRHPVPQLPRRALPGLRGLRGSLHARRRAASPGHESTPDASAGRSS